MEFNKICVVGLGYIGLPTAAVFAARKKHVLGVDVRPEIVATVNNGKIHIKEPDLDMLVHAAVTEGYLRASQRPARSDAFLIAVPTPLTDDNQPDLDYIETSARAIAPVLERGNLVVLESTSPVGATEKMAEWLAEERPDLSFPQTAGADADVQIAHCPERVLPGNVLREIVQNDRLIGGMTERCSSAAAALYGSFVLGQCIKTSARTAEMAKLTENAFRDVNIAFANELSTIADRLDIDVWELISLANRHPRVNILQPGPGVGGHCIAVDPWFIVSKTPDESRLIRTARNVNDAKPDWVIAKVRAACDAFKQAQRDRTPSIGCFGLTFKADIDDLRESPALTIVERLASQQLGDLIVVDPNVAELPPQLANLEGVQLLDAEAAMQTIDILLLLVDHREFKGLAPHQRSPAIEVIDTRGLWQERR